MVIPQQDTLPTREFAFKTKGAGLPVPCVSAQELLQIFAILEAQYFVSKAQVAEAAALSIAMVIRHALGLSAAQGVVGVIVKNSLAGAAALATARHLFNSGARILPIVLSENTGSENAIKPFLPEVAFGINALESLGVKPAIVNGSKGQEMVGEMVEVSHHCLLGTFDGEGDLPLAIAGQLNESVVPLHTIMVPPGIELESGQPQKEPIMAATTVSLGVPLSATAIATDFVGRHYLCDISLPEALLKAMGYEMPPVFCEQPVLQLLPNS